MTKRKGGDDASKKKKKARYMGNQMVEPWWSGIYVTCVRGKERFCKQQTLDMFMEYAETIYGEDFAKLGADGDGEDTKEGPVDIDDEIAKELAALKPANSKKAVFSIVDLDCECLFFIRAKKPVDVEEFVQRMCEDILSGKFKAVARHVQRLTPVTTTATANLEGVKRISTVLDRHFHQADNQEPYKFAIRTAIRNHNIMTRDEVIKTVAECVGNEHGHSVDLKNYNKLILVECFRSSVGISVVDKFDSLMRFNIEALRMEYHKRLREPEEAKDLDEKVAT